MNYEPVVGENLPSQSGHAYIDAFLQSLDIRASSKYTYKRQLKEYIIWQTKLNIVTPSREDILRYKEYLQENRALSALTIGGYLTAVRRFFEWLEAEKIYPNIARGVKGPKRRKGFKKDALTLEQAKTLLKSIDKSSLTGKRDFAILNLMLRTGLRTIEIIRATKEDITRQSGEIVLFIQGKGRDSKDDFVVLTESTIEPIRIYMNERGKLKDNDPIFASHSTKNFGKKLTTRSISRIVKNRLRAININDDRLTAHSLRHSAITFSLLAGATTQEARLLARHTDINTTLIYAHNINRIKEAPEHKIEDFFKD